MLPAESIGWLIFFVIALAIFAFGVTVLRADRRSGVESFGILLTVGSGLVLVAMLGAAHPFPARYHMLELHTGKVVKVEQRVVTDGGEYANMTKEVAFWLDGERNAYITEDVRLTSLKDGQAITLRRQASWNYGGEDTWHVTYVQAPTN